MANVDVRKLGKKTPNKKVVKSKSDKATKSIPVDWSKVVPQKEPGKRLSKTGNPRRRKKKR